MENARENRKKGRKNAFFFAGMWKSPLKMRFARGPRHPWSVRMESSSIREWAIGRSRVEWAPRALASHTLGLFLVPAFSSSSTVVAQHSQHRSPTGSRCCRNRTNSANLVDNIDGQPLRRGGTVNCSDLSRTKDHACFRVNHFEDPVVCQEGPRYIDIDIGSVAVVDDADAPLAHLGPSVKRILQQIAFHPDGVGFHKYRSSRAKNSCRIVS